MQIVFNSRLPEAACTLFYHDAFARLSCFCCYDYDHWEKYDIALFMTYKVDLEDLKHIKEKNPSLITGIIDPRGSWVTEYLQYADFLIVDSIEMRDFWSGADCPIFEYAEYPDLKVLKNDHLKKKERTIIGYHGNVVHLESMRDNIAPALEQLSNKYDIELWAMYNIAGIGEWKRNLPAIKVRHIQWSMQNFFDYMAKVDIGIVPCFMPEKTNIGCRGLLGKRFNRLIKSKDDYLLRFKMPTNPGRIIVWGLLNIPVVSDFFPSAMQCINDGLEGLLACSAGGWFRALEKFIENPLLRQTCADNLTSHVEDRYSFSNQNKALLEFFESEFGFGTHNKY